MTAVLPQLLDTDGVAAVLGITPGEVRRLRRLGLLSGINIARNTSTRGARWRYDPADVRRFIDRRRTA